ncbi:DASH complex subunit Dam1-domain-containing protein [Penicillium lagena]|uniref:DASH complex subunit Dam1-domain-containing protein n=1 Tax=Penicillium lagena TaxID=94218 RepID=UPI00253F8661|nr:DASH complex subunit Dam1-domain-containing protein [Penicillium lagena]KAJ5606459.1 DASH complex subunit Dam1-domain-containing protein [Penicillium lagena]
MDSAPRSSRSSLREAHGYAGSISNADYTQSPINALEPQFAELADSMADLEANFMHLQLMHESLTRFSESFASFLYGLNMNAFCVDFPEVRSGDAEIKTNLLNDHHRPRLPIRFAERSRPSRRQVGYAQWARMMRANHSDADDPIRSTEEAEMTFL